MCSFSSWNLFHSSEHLNFLSHSKPCTISYHPNSFTSQPRILVPNLAGYLTSYHHLPLVESWQVKLHRISPTLNPHNYLCSLDRLYSTETHPPFMSSHPSSFSRTPARHPQTFSNQFNSSFPIPSARSKKLSHPRYAMHVKIQSSNSR